MSTTHSHSDPEIGSRRTMEVANPGRSTKMNLRTPLEMPMMLDAWQYIKAEERPATFTTWSESIQHIVTLSWLNILFLALPFAWAAHWNVDRWGHETTFVLCFLAMIPLQKIFDWGGERLGAFLVSELRDLVVITLSNAVEATLAIILLLKCELRLLQSTIIGIVLLHLLLVPGTAFFVEGASVYQQQLESHHTDLNLCLLMIGVLATLVPTAFFAALDRGAVSQGNGTQASSDTGLPPSFVPLVSDFVRRDILRMSRGISVILLVVYIATRLWHHLLRPCAQDTAPKACECQCNKALPKKPRFTKEKSPPAIVCVILLLVAVGLMAPTAEFLVSSIDPIREQSGIQTEWFGLILLPIVSFSPDGAIAIFKFILRIKQAVQSLKSTKKAQNGTPPPAAEDRREYSTQGDGSTASAEDEFAHGRPIDLSIQFTLWWTPFLVLLGWWTDRPMHMLFDYFEVALLLGACFLVNYVLTDQKTNSAEGLAMISFYAIIATAVWYYPGQPQVAFLLHCPGSVAEAVASGVEGLNE